MIEIVSDGLKDEIERCFLDSETSIRIVSPFLSCKMAELLCSIHELKKDIECAMITRIYMKDLVEGANSLDALTMLVENGIEVYALQALHAKVYLFDDSEVIIGSANFTWSGLNKNCELSIITDDTNILTKASAFYDSLIEYCKNNNGQVTKELLDTVRTDYDKAYKERQKDFGFVSSKMYGAERKRGGNIIKSDWKIDDIKIEDKDPVFDLLSGSQKKTTFRHNIWAKFEGRADNRQPGNEKPTLSEVEIDGSRKYIINFRHRPNSIQSGDQLYIVSLTTDENGKPTTRIVGRGKAISYHNKNRVHPEWIRKYEWMSYYCFFCEIVDVEILNVKSMDCIALDQVYDVLGKRTYTSTIDKEEVKNMSLCQCRRPYLQMTLDAKDYIDKEIDRLAAVHGFIKV